MANILYLVHRLPYPPDKGDKVRSYNVLKHLLQRHRVFLGTFVDDEQDLQHIDALRSLCADLHVVRLHPRLARLRSVRAFATGEPLTLHYYADAGLKAWVERTLKGQAIEVAIVFSSSMAQYVEGHQDLRVLIDLVDVDSAKWQQYGERHTGPKRWLYRRESQALLRYERRIVAGAEHSYLVTDNEVDLFRSLAPECDGRVESMGNGVDADYFAPDAARSSPYAAGERALVFTGAMDYWPNIDAVTWFASDVLPRLRANDSALRLVVVGRNPSIEVRALAGEGVIVTGTVPDVRPYLQHAAVAVAPLRVARGIQNKLLEAMAMGVPVIASPACVTPLRAQVGREVLTAADAADFVREVEDLLRDVDRAQAIGAAGRRRVVDSYSWSAHLRQLDDRLAMANAA